MSECYQNQLCCLITVILTHGFTIVVTCTCNKDGQLKLIYKNWGGDHDHLRYTVHKSYHTSRYLVLIKEFDVCNSCQNVERVFHRTCVNASRSTRLSI